MTRNESSVYVSLWEWGYCEHCEAVKWSDDVVMLSGRQRRTTHVPRSQYEMGRCRCRQFWYCAMWTETGQTNNLLENGLLRGLDTRRDATMTAWWPTCADHLLMDNGQLLFILLHHSSPLVNICCAPIICYVDASSVYTESGRVLFCRCFSVLFSPQACQVASAR